MQTRFTGNSTKHMMFRGKSHKANRRQRLRSQGYWGIGIGAVGYTGCVVGVVQLWLFGEVSIRTGHDPVSGDSAVQMLYILALVSSLFAGIGAFLLYRSGRRSGVD